MIATRGTPRDRGPSIDRVDAAPVVGAILVMSGRDVVMRVTFHRQSRGSGMQPVYCLVRGLGVRATGQVGGCGYHKTSAALADALGNAGLSLSEPIDGYGDTAMRDALHAVAVALGVGDPWIVDAV